MEKILILLVSLFLTTQCYATTAETHTTYAVNSEVNNTNLNGNLNNIRTVVNGNLDNTNARTSGGFRFYEVLGSTPSAGTEGRAVYNTATDKFLIDDGSTFNAIGTRKYIGNTTRAMDAATGSASITGVGFQPDLVIFNAAYSSVATESNYSWGQDDATTANLSYLFISGATNGGGVNTTNSLFLADGDGSNYQIGKISSMDSGGFTISWTKNGSPAAGTAYVEYVVYKF